VFGVHKKLYASFCRFLSALTPLQPRYAKKIADEDSLMAVIIAQAMNHGNLNRLRPVTSR
jgi:hypothetical protein